MSQAPARQVPGRPVIDGATVLITGASSGIGAAIAARLAPRAGALVLVGRRRAALEALAALLRSAQPLLRVRVESCDLADAAALEALAEAVLALPGGIDILVNNAGSGDLGFVEAADWSRLDRMIRLNIVATTRLTQRLLPAMRARGRGGIVNIGSGAGTTWMPAMAVYVGSKHFVDGFSESLRAELLGSGIVVTQVCPGPVETGFDAAAGIDPRAMGGLPGWLRIGADQCAREAMAAFEKGRARVHPGWRFRTLMRLSALTPRFLQRLALRSALALPGLRALRRSASDPP